MNFEMTGKLSISKASDKFQPYSEVVFDSGWKRKRLIFNLTAGSNRHSLALEDGSWEDGHGEIYTLTEKTISESGEVQKGESIKIPFKERLTSPRIAEVANFKKYVIDLEKPGRRYDLQKAAERLNEGKNLTDEELEKLGLENESQVNEALEKSKKRRHEFIAKWDFIDFVKKVIESGKYDNSNFFIRGKAEYSYNVNTGKLYESLVPSRIYLADKDATPSALATIILLFDQNSLDEMSVDEKGKCYVNGHMMEYESQLKKNIPVEVQIAIDVPGEDASEKDKKKFNAIKHKFMLEDDSIKEYGVVVNMINGAQKVEITEDMLTEEQLSDLDCGLITMDDIREEMGGNVYGEKIKEYQFVKPSRGYTKGRQDTVYTAEDMVITVDEKKDDNDGDDDEGLFDDDDEL